MAITLNVHPVLYGAWQQYANSHFLAERALAIADSIDWLSPPSALRVRASSLKEDR